MAAAPAPHPLDVLDVLTRAGGDRERLGQVVGEQLDDLDALLVSDVLRAAGRVGDALALRRQLVRLCAILRALDAAERELIDAVELRAGLRLAAATTDRFESFAGARVLLRTVLELLERDESPRLDGPLRAQASLLHAELRAFVLEQLTGSPQGDLAPADAPHAAPSPLDPFAVTDPDLARAHDALVDELLHGAAHHPVTGLLGAAWMRDWSAVPLVGEQLAEDDPDEPDRLLAAIAGLPMPPSSLVLAALRPEPRWHLAGRTLVVDEGLRRSWRMPVTAGSLRAVAATRTRWCVLTTPDLDFAIVEGAGHHALLGPAPLVTTACAVPPLEAIARFREHVEELAGDDDPPAELLAVAQSFGRLRRRSR